MYYQNLVIRDKQEMSTEHTLTKNLECLLRPIFSCVQPFYE
jgi:hypothetical protein